MKVGCPIFPVGITGTDAIQPVDAKLPKLRQTCTITIGRPVRPERYQGRSEPHQACRSMIDEVMFEIREMTGQEYHNRYAGTAAEATGESRPTAKPAHVGDEPTAERELVGAHH
jgi:1-acyl-sn-glycerol-3-phosphate acyltransferase